MKKQVEVNGKIFEVGDTVVCGGLHDRKILGIGELGYLYSYTASTTGKYCEDCRVISDLYDWTVKNIEREKIELKAYIGDFGRIAYFTVKGEYPILANTVNNKLVKNCYFKKYSPIPELPSKFIWADNLEYCDSEIGKAKSK